MLILRRSSVARFCASCLSRLARPSSSWKMSDESTVLSRKRNDLGDRRAPGDASHRIGGDRLQFGARGGAVGIGELFLQFAGGLALGAPPVDFREARKFARRAGRSRRRAVSAGSSSSSTSPAFTWSPVATWIAEILPGSSGWITLARPARSILPCATACTSSRPKNDQASSAAKNAQIVSISATGIGGGGVPEFRARRAGTRGRGR